MEQNTSFNNYAKMMVIGKPLNKDVMESLWVSTKYPISEFLWGSVNRSIWIYASNELDSSVWNSADQTQIVASIWEFVNLNINKWI
jgi:hypothetical protein